MFTYVKNEYQRHVAFIICKHLVSIKLCTSALSPQLNSLQEEQPPDKIIPESLNHTTCTV